MNKVLQRDYEISGFIFVNFVIAQTVSNFALLDWKGKNFILYNELNQISKEELLVFNFMNSTCVPCKQEVPELLKLTEENPSLETDFCFHWRPR